MRDRGIIVLSDGLKRCTITCCWFDEDGSAAGFLPEPVDSHRVVRRCAVPKDALKCHESLYLGFTCDVAEESDASNVASPVQHPPRSGALGPGQCSATSRAPAGRTDQSSFLTRRECTKRAPNAMRPIVGIRFNVDVGAVTCCGGVGDGLTDDSWQVSTMVALVSRG